MLDFKLRSIYSVRDLEYIDDLRHEGYAGVNRNCLADQTKRHAATVPMLIEILDTARNGV